MKTIQKMYEQLHWANERILDVIRSKQPGHLQAIRLFSHILQAERVWLTRLQGGDSSALPIWSDADPDACAQLAEQNRSRFGAYLDSLNETELDRLLSYRNQSGKPFSDSVRNILIHVALHGQYHRGQINAALRAEGLEPVNVDYITFVRS